MKHLLLSTIAAVMLAGCGMSSGSYTVADDGYIKDAKELLARARE
jgi:hypothetical protein